MQFEGDPRVLKNLWQKKLFMAADDTAHEAIRPMLMGLGGTMRGVYSAAQILQLEEHGLIEAFDDVIGVSTSAPMAGYCLAGQAHIVPSIYLEEGTSRKFMSMRRGLLGGDPVDLDYAASVFRGATGKALDQEAVRRSRARYHVAVTHAETGESLLVDAKALPDMVEAIRASIAIPGSSRVVQVAGIPALDGSIGSPMPIQQACEQFRPTDVLILANRPEHDSTSGFLLDLYMRHRSNESPRFVRALKNQELRFWQELEWLRGQRDVRYGIIWSDDTVGALTCARDKLVLAMERAQRHLYGLLAVAVTAS